jgi:hypothetical protein
LRAVTGVTLLRALHTFSGGPAAPRAVCGEKSTLRSLNLTAHRKRLPEIF